MLKRYRRETVEAYSSHNIMEVRFVPLLPDVAPPKEAKRRSRGLRKGLLLLPLMLSACLTPTGTQTPAEVVNYGVRGKARGRQACIP